MKARTATAILTLMLALTSASAFAQHGGGHGKGQGHGNGQMSTEQRLEHLTAELDLTDDQIPLVQAILDEQREAAIALREARRDGTMDRSALREEMMSIRESGREAMEAVLTDDQIAKLEELQSSRRGRMGRGRGN
ncbi:MAG: Spy/CpxP family protein refolding chaperone [Pseudomonadota bacterium]